jgi:small subunit ribosomal protein S4
MGDPKKLRKKYSTPSHPWQKLRIDEEKILMKEYGFKNKKELWKLNSRLKKYKSQVKSLISKHDPDSLKKKNELINRLKGYNLLPENAILEDVLAISMKDLCERRLSTIVYKKNLARSVKQARQFITHEHISIGDKKITSPSYIVSHGEELMIKLSDNSPISSEDHPERVPLEKQIKKEIQKITSPKKEKKVEEEIEEDFVETLEVDIPEEELPILSKVSDDEVKEDE